MNQRLSILTIVLSLSSPAAADWTAWRGPEGTGIAPVESAPLRWSPTENIKWKVALPAPGNSTPVVWKDLVFITQATNNGHHRALQCYSRADGKLLWEQGVDYAADEPTHDTNPFCSASATTDGERIIVWHGSAGVFAYDLEGRELWKRDLGKFDHVWGNAASPVLYKNLVLMNCGPGLSTFLLALDKKTGEDVWKATPAEATSEKLDEFRGSWSTPVLHRTKGGDEFLVSLPNRLLAFDPLTGKERWWCRGLSKLAYTSPLVADGVAVAMSGYHGPALAVRTGGEGDVTETHRLWLHDQKIPQRIGSGVIVDGHIFILNESGIANCYDLRSGEQKWEQRLRGGNSWSSMCLAAGRLYVISMSGATTVLAPNPAACEVLAENPLGEMTRASLAFSGGQIFARTYNHLYCIEQPQE